jgi:hypothetical protein
MAGFRRTNQTQHERNSQTQYETTIVHSNPLHSPFGDTANDGRPAILHEIIGDCSTKVGCDSRRSK